ncbi:pectinesterase family protein [Coprobacter fastidiosus]|jgi:hypothetical protein|uniref:pectinesterase family protein n=1 Tax=Coprobacter fastidiosus TaxID=1099853 RepID=UPI0026705654|nr:pectinesterase family protein [Coprobacter fastidiosus]
MKTFACTFFLSFVLVFSIYADTAYPVIVVAQDGSGDFITIQDAINSVRDFTPVPRVIHIKKGIYYEKVEIPSWKCDITLKGDGPEETLIYYDDYASLRRMGTFRTYTLQIRGNRVTLENLTVENRAGRVGQAVALHVEGDCVAVRNCRLLGNQDTLFTGNENSRQYYDRCYIEGTTDYIFGPATCWFDHCILHSKSDSYITAASTPENHKNGYVFYKCNLTAAEGVVNVYLGRPWRPYASVVFLECRMGKHIRPEGWHNWRNAANEKTARYAEYASAGEGADPESRVSWSSQLDEDDVSLYIPESVLEGDWFRKTCVESVYKKSS